MKMDMAELLDAQSASQFYAAPTVDGAAQSTNSVQGRGVSRTTTCRSKPKNYPVFCTSAG